VKAGRNCQKCQNCQKSPKLKGKIYRGFTRMSADQRNIARSANQDHLAMALAINNNRDVLKVRRRSNHVFPIGGWIFTSIHSRHALIIDEFQQVPSVVSARFVTYLRDHKALFHQRLERTDADNFAHELAGHNTRHQ
jgi:hypothetical protein